MDEYHAAILEARVTYTKRDKKLNLLFELGKSTRAILSSGH